MLVEVEKERNRVAKEVAIAHQIMEKSSKVRSLLDSFSIEGKALC